MPVVLREVRESDIAAFYEQQADPEAAQMAAFTSRDRATLEKNWHRIMADDTIVARTITAGGEVCGHIVSWQEKCHRELGYWVGRESWGRGIATAAVQTFLAVVAERPLEAWVAPHNIGSIRVLEKNGFGFDRDEDGYRVFRL